MNRLLHGSVALLALYAATPALAADYADFGDIRPAYGQDWGTDEDTIEFEAGVRYWYSIGQQKHEIQGFSETMNTKTSSGELFARVNDLATRSYVEAVGGYGISHGGDYSNNGGANLDLPAARMGYLGADFGWLPFGTDTANFGFVTGYQYTNDSPDTGRVDFTTAETSGDIAWSDQTGGWSVGGDSEINDFNIHALKIGVAGRLDANAFDITGEAYATPYAYMNGTYGAYDAGYTDNYYGGPDGISYLQASTTTVTGFGYGGGGKLMVGFHPTENFTIRVGGRASYLQGQYDATYDAASVTHPTTNPPTVDPFTGVITPADPRYNAPTLSKQTYIIDNNPFSMFRYGGLLEVSGSF